MEKHIIIIIIVIILLSLIIFFKSSKTNENLYIEDSDMNIINNVTKYYLTNDKTKIPNISINGSLLVGNIEFKNLILNYKYPIGSFYVQYPDSEIDFYTRGTTIVTPFPEANTPAKMFGGKWIDMWNNESVYFRTGTDNTAAFESIDVCETGITGNEKCEIKETIDSRIDGFQDYALRNITGWTSWSQGPYGNGGPKSCEGNSGVFTKCENAQISTDENTGWGAGHQSIFDTTYFFKEKYGESLYKKYISDDEVRVRNRLIKVWKRVE